ncbi:MAG: hypothetical protein KKB74_12720 [Bacteroidetes bacterium]|nr:hypothetical protein [Bacteroidota bacterium]
MGYKFGRRLHDVNILLILSLLQHAYFIDVNLHILKIILNYEGVNNGSLMGAIRHESGWSPMPKNTNQLDDCTIRKLEIWVANDTPNN